MRLRKYDPSQESAPEVRPQAAFPPPTVGVTARANAPSPRPNETPVPQQGSTRMEDPQSLQEAWLQRHTPLRPTPRPSPALSPKTKYTTPRGSKGDHEVIARELMRPPKYGGRSKREQLGSVTESWGPSPNEEQRVGLFQQEPEPPSPSGSPVQDWLAHTYAAKATPWPTQPSQEAGFSSEQGHKLNDSSSLGLWAPQAPSNQAMYHHSRYDERADGGGAVQRR